MDVRLFFKGLILGLSIAAPVGPIGVLCIRRTLARGRAIGLVSGLGAATADAVYGCIAGFGLAFVTDLLEKTGVMVTPGRGYGQWGEGFFRISLTYPDEVLAEAMDRIVEMKL